MALSKDDAVKKARRDLAKRLKLSEADIKEESTERTEFPDMALGAGVGGEMSGQMMTSGWRIRLKAAEHGSFEYRANEDQIRLYNFKGSNYRI